MLDQQDKEDLQIILQKMYPTVPDFRNHEPTVATMEEFLKALDANLFCHRAMTELSAGLVTGLAGRLYTGRNKRAIRQILKKIRESFEEKGLYFYICNQAVKLKMRTRFTLSLDGALSSAPL